MRGKGPAQAREPPSYLERPISLAALSVIELTSLEMVTAVSRAGCCYTSLRLLPVTPDEPRYGILGNLHMRRDEDRATAGTWPQTRWSAEGGICCPNSGDASSAPLL